VTDKKQFEGEIVLTPDGKNLKLVRGFVPAKFENNNP
jgi:hypothetical protein